MSEETKAIEIVRQVPSPISILQRAVESGANPDTLAKLLELHERFEANEARKQFEVSFAAFKTEAPKLEKSKEVGYETSKGRTSYKYTPLDHIANTLGPILAKHGLSYNWKQDCSAGGSIQVTCVLRHVQGHSIDNTLASQSDPSGSKNSIQAIGSAVTYLRRYTLLGILGMATSDEDTDGVTMGNACDLIAGIEAASDIHELSDRYREAIKEALNSRDPRAVKLFMDARKKREQEIANG